MILSRDQIAVFTRRVAALSSGQVAVPSVQINRSEAVALWRDLRVVFGSLGGGWPGVSVRGFGAVGVRDGGLSVGFGGLGGGCYSGARGLVAWGGVSASRLWLF